MSLKHMLALASLVVLPACQPQLLGDPVYCSPLADDEGTLRCVVGDSIDAHPPVPPPFIHPGVPGDR